MRLLDRKIVLVCTISASLGVLSAATTGIGVAMSEGNIVINSASTAGNATVFNGSTVETQSAASQVRLKDGAQLRLASDSKGTVYSDHIDLQKGSARITGYAANASGLSVRAEGKSSASVSVRDQGVVEIAALTGDVHVFNAAGFNVANLVPGRALDLRAQDAGASAPSSLTGCAVRSGENLLLTDETSNVTVQLRGGNVKTGQRVQITGSMVPNTTPVSGATQVINVTNVKTVGGTCKAGAVAAAGGAAAGAGAAAAGAGAGAAAGGAAVAASTAVIAGAAVATGVGVGVAAAAGATGSTPTVTTGTVSSGRVGAFN